MRDEFNSAITVHPILQGDNFYLLNAYFLKVIFCQIVTILV
jgi:hypothetical protein